MDRELLCPKCQAVMIEGWIKDSTYGGVAQSSWVPGKPERSFWGRLKFKKEQLHPITAFRCTKCGYLEIYASIHSTLK